MCSDCNKVEESIICVKVKASNMKQSFGLEKWKRKRIQVGGGKVSLLLFYSALSITSWENLWWVLHGSGSSKVGSTYMAVGRSIFPSLWKRKQQRMNRFISTVELAWLWEQSEQTLGAFSERDVGALCLSYLMRIFRNEVGESKRESPIFSYLAKV